MGRGTDLSPRKKALVACMLDQGESSQCEIAKKLKISQKSVSRVKVSVQEGTPLSPDRKGKCGRKSKFSPRLLRKMVQIAKTNRRATSREICEKLKEYGTEVSPSIVRRRLCAEGLPARRPRKKAKLTPAMAKKRILWAKDMQEKFQNNCNKVVFSDESIFSVGEESGQYVRRTTSEMFDPKVNKEIMAETLKKWESPPNLPSRSPPNLNPEIDKAVAGTFSQTRDIQAKYDQGLVGRGLSALGMSVPLYYP
ncbi:hypothetical protein GE061_018997 [Apolygus lucorum]|uniref:Transposase Tc1-like domain-containing protein n=1 Tax=Apolygus lucorum TaxID=248454 RepID=A0A8S9X8L3_APOLU|nr:hypothetical protein GE061_018997 [Apolygus lucorum]